MPAFSHAWRALERPVAAVPVPADELRLRRATRLLRGFGTLWRDPAVPDNLREEALHEIFERVDVDGPEVVAVYPQPNENAWLLGHATLGEDLGVVGARGLGPTLSNYPSSSYRRRRRVTPWLNSPLSGRRRPQPVAAARYPGGQFIPLPARKWKER